MKSTRMTVAMLMAYSVSAEVENIDKISQTLMTVFNILADGEQVNQIERE